MNIINWTIKTIAIYVIRVGYAVTIIIPFYGRSVWDDTVLAGLAYKGLTNKQKTVALRKALK